MSPEFHFTPAGELCFAGAVCGWELRFSDRTSLTPQGCPPPQISGDGDCRTIVWEKAPWRVTVAWQAAEENRCAGTIEVEGIMPEAITVTAVVFPSATVNASAESRIFLPVNQGVETAPAAELPFGVVESRIYKTMQFVAVYDEKSGCLFDHRDPAWNNKQFEFVRLPDSCRLQYCGIHTPPLPKNGRALRFRTDYENSVISFRGNWYHAARLYRQWGIRQSWATAKRDNARLREIGVWLWNRGAAEHVAAPAEQLQRDAGVPVALDWYWWHSNPYDTDYPNYWPPREGETLFRRTIERLKAQGIFTQVYLNGMCWDVDNPTFADGGLDSIDILRDGSLRAVPFNVFNHHRLGFICAEGEPFFARLEKQIEKLVDAGLPGIYLDMIGCASYEDCFNPRHNHLPGGGSYQVAGFRRFLGHLRERFPGVKFCTEECNEAYMDLFDSVIALDPSAERQNCTPQWNYVPAFSAVYHGILPTFGSYALPDGIPPFDPLWPTDGKLEKERDWITLYPLQFQIELARGILWGQQPMAANLTMENLSNPQVRPLYDFLCRSAKFYHTHRDFLFDGEMLDPETLECDIVEISFNQRMIFTKEAQLRSVTKPLPAVLHSRWRAKDGRELLVLCNYTTEPRTATWRNRSFRLPPMEYFACTPPA